MHIVAIKVVKDGYVNVPRGGVAEEITGLICEDLTGCRETLCKRCARMSFNLSWFSGIFCASRQGSGFSRWWCLRQRNWMCCSSIAAGLFEVPLYHRS